MSVREEAEPTRDEQEACIKQLMEEFYAAFAEEPLPNGEYVHLGICSGSRRHPAGTPGKCCVCLPKTRAKVHALESQLTALAVERDAAWGDLGFTKNDLANALYRAESAESQLTALRQERDEAIGILRELTDDCTCEFRDCAIHDAARAFLESALPPFPPLPPIGKGEAG